MSDPDPKDLIDLVRDYVNRQMVAGFDSPSLICDSAVEIFCDDAKEETIRQFAERLTRDAARRLAHEQSNWPDVTDCDRLDDAFAELTRSGIVCRQNFTCCGTCGMAEIGREFQLEEDRGLTGRGFAFYHMQDTESAADGHGVYLYYGAVEPGESAGLQVAKEIVESLHRHGLHTTWNGRLDTRIHVQMDWKRRRPFEIEAKI